MHPEDSSASSYKYKKTSAAVDVQYLPITENSTNDQFFEWRINKSGEMNSLVTVDD